MTHDPNAKSGEKSLEDRLCHAAVRLGPRRRYGIPRAMLKQHLTSAFIRMHLDSSVVSSSGEHVDGLGRYCGGYRIRHVPKRSGGVRRLEIPDPVTRCLQWSLVKVMSSAPRGKGRRGPLQNALIHERARTCVRCDIANFYDSISANAVRQALESLIRADGKSLGPPEIDLAVRLVCHRNRVPQGAPSSPWIADLVLGPIEVVLRERADELGLTVSRYVDDFYISDAGSTIELGGSDPRELIPVLRRSLEGIGLSINPRKTRRHRRRAGIPITGFSVERSGLFLSADVRRRIREIEMVVDSASIRSNQQVLTELADHSMAPGGELPAGVAIGAAVLAWMRRWHVEIASELPPDRRSDFWNQQQVFADSMDRIAGKRSWLRVVRDGDGHRAIMVDSPGKRNVFPGESELLLAIARLAAHEGDHLLAVLRLDSRLSGYEGLAATRSGLGATSCRGRIRALRERILKLPIDGGTVEVLSPEQYARELQRIAAAEEIRQVLESMSDRLGPAIGQGVTQAISCCLEAAQGIMGSLASRSSEEEILKQIDRLAWRLPVDSPSAIDRREDREDHFDAITLLRTRFVQQNGVGNERPPGYDGDELFMLLRESSRHLRHWLDGIDSQRTTIFNVHSPRRMDRPFVRDRWENSNAQLVKRRISHRIRWDLATSIEELLRFEIDMAIRGGFLSEGSVRDLEALRHDRPIRSWRDIGDTALHVGNVTIERRGPLRQEAIQSLLQSAARPSQEEAMTLEMRAFVGLISTLEKEANGQVDRLDFGGGGAGVRPVDRWSVHSLALRQHSAAHGGGGEVESGLDRSTSARKHARLWCLLKAGVRCAASSERIAERNDEFLHAGLGREIHGVIIAQATRAIRLLNDCPNARDRYQERIRDSIQTLLSKR